MATEWSDKIVISELSDEPALSEELSAICERLAAEDDKRVPHVVLNFGAVTYVNSSNIAQLLRLRKRLHECHRELKICSVSDQVWSVMMVTGLDKVFRFAPDPMTALAALQLLDAKE
jgi:anti-anti-sigma factor